MNIRKPLSVMLTHCVMAGASIVGCAVTGPYNPDHLGADDFARIAGVCQSVMGLSPTDRPTGGNWLGNDRLDYWTSHYNGCILSLSDSLRTVQDTLATQQAQEACLRKGLRPGSPDLALCVVQTANSHPDPTPTPANMVVATPPSASSRAPGSFYRASPRETARREQVACAAIGISPVENAFRACVKSLSDTFYSIDHPIN